MSCDICFPLAKVKLILFIHSSLPPPHSFWFPQILQNELVLVFESTLLDRIPVMWEVKWSIFTPLKVLINLMLLVKWSKCPAELWMCFCVACNRSYITYLKGEFLGITSVLCFDKPVRVLMHKSKQAYRSLMLPYQFVILRFFPYTTFSLFVLLCW